MSNHKCSKCGHSYHVPILPSAIKEIVFRSDSRVALDKYLSVTCPRCGHVEDANERRFFGVFGPKAVRVFLFLFVAAMIAAVAYVIYLDLK